MKRQRVNSAQIRSVDRLRSGETGRALTIAQACVAVGISPAIYYRHKQNEQLFPGLQRDWEALTESFRPSLPATAYKLLPAGGIADLRDAVGGEFRRVYSKPAFLASARQLDRAVRPFASQLSKLMRIYCNLHPDHREHARTAARIAGPDPDFELDEVMQALLPVSSGFLDGLRTLSETEGVTPRGRGGRKFDSRPRLIAGQLASLFASAVGLEPTAWRFDKTPAGAFNIFALNAFEHFLGRNVSDDHAVSEAITWVAWHIDHKPEAAGKEVAAD